MKQKESTALRFDNLGISNELVAVLKKNNFTTPTPIQHQVIPDAIKGKDVVGIAQTGTGKTFAFGIPMIERLVGSKNQGVILVPTRELAMQVEASLRKIGLPFNLRTALIIGGVPQFKQEQALRRHPHIIIATPGRLDDLMDQGKCSLDAVTIVTLDEADRMLDVGFLTQIQRVLNTVSKKKQVMLFSATMPKAISKLTVRFMKMPLRIEIAPQGTSAKNIEQEVLVITKNKKLSLLQALLKKYAKDKILVFSRTKHGAKRIAKQVQNMGHTSAEIHSNRTQAQRKFALEGFSKGRFRVMVATDIAARGIDISDIAVVINYDLPDNSEDYVHRIGRTGRAGKYGRAISFVTPSQKADIRKIEKLIQKSLPVLALPKLEEIANPPQREERKNRPQQHRKTRDNRSWGKPKRADRRRRTQTR